MWAFISHQPRKNPRPNYLLFFDKHQGRVVINCCPNPHLWVYKKILIQNSVFNPFLSTPEYCTVTVVLCIHIYFWNAGKYLKEQYFITAPHQQLGAEREEKQVNIQNGSMTKLWQQQVCNIIQNNVYYKQIRSWLSFVRWYVNSFYRPLNEKQLPSKLGFKEAETLRYKDGQRLSNRGKSAKKDFGIL